MKAKKKIFIYIHQCVLKGGVERVFYNLLNNISTEKYDVTVLSYVAYLKDDLDIQLYPSNVKRHWLYYDQLSKNCFKRLFQRIHNHVYPKLCKFFICFQKYDTAIAAQEGMYADFVNKYVHANKKLLWIHNDMSLCHWTKQYFGDLKNEITCYKEFDNIVCVSEDVKKSMIDTFGIMNNLVVRYNPIDTNEIETKKMEFIIQHPSSPLFVAVGRLAKQKGYDRLLNICKKLRDDGFDFCVWILGDGEERANLERLISENNLTQVTLLGNQKNPFPYIMAADWVICTSRHEGFNMVLHEAVWCGTPIITTNNAGAHELLGDNKYGIITENDDEAFYNALKKVLTDPSIATFYRKAVAKRRNFIDIKERIEKIEELL